jgi:hypothetical protein
VVSPADTYKQTCVYNSYQTSKLPGSDSSLAKGGMCIGFTLHMLQSPKDQVSNTWPFKCTMHHLLYVHACARTAHQQHRHPHACIRLN